MSASGQQQLTPREEPKVPRGAQEQSGGFSEPVWAKADTIFKQTLWKELTPPPQFIG